MFRWSCACYVTLAIATFATMPVHSQGHSAEQQACFDRRADKSADLDNRIAACRGVIDAAALDATIRAEAHLRRALAYAQKAAQSSNAEDIERAIADLSEGMRLDPNNPAGQRYVYLTRAGLYFHKGDHDRALVDYTALIGLEPKSAMAYGYRGSVYATIGDHERAIADYAEAIRLEPNVARLHHQRASSYLLAGKADDALADADRAVALDPNDAASYSTRVVVYRTLGKSDGVVSDLRRALSLDPSNDGIREELQLAERTKSAAQPVRQGTDARIDAEASEGSTKAAAQFYNQRAWTRLQAGKAVAALPEVDRALELDATNVAYYSTRALINRTLGRDSETIADLRKALSLDPSNNGIKQELEKLEQAQIAAAEVREKERLDQLREARDAAKIKEPTETTVAAGAASAPDLVRLARDLQEELKRVGCDPGAVDGNWSNKSQAALEKFASHAKLMLSLGEPTTAALDAVSAQKGRVCLLECDEQAVEERGQCVARPR